MSVHLLSDADTPWLSCEELGAGPTAFAQELREGHPPTLPL